MNKEMKEEDKMGKRNSFIKKVYNWITRKIECSSQNLVYWRKIGVKQQGNLLVLKNAFVGRRCFIIGNGPSLRKHDLGKLSTEIKFATNMFLLNKDVDKINLDFFCSSDKVHWKRGFFPKVWYEVFPRLKNTTFFFEKSAFPVYQRTAQLQDKRVFFLNLDQSCRVYNGKFSVDVAKKVCIGKSVVIDFCLPLAFYLGFSKIYLIGCDFDYDLGNPKDSFFYKAELDDRELVKGIGGSIHLQQIFGSFKIIKKIFEANGRKIYNAGYEGKLETFERVHYDELF